MLEKPVVSFVKDYSIDRVYFSLLREAYLNGRRKKISTGSYAGDERVEFDFASGVITDPTRRPLTPDFPPGTVPVTSEQDIENYFVNYLMNNCLGKNEHYKYATWITGGDYSLPEFTEYNGTEIIDRGVVPRIKFDRLKKIKVPDQIGWCIKHYLSKGLDGNNHCYIQVGYPESNLAYDISYRDESNRMTSPCLRGIDTSIVKEEGEYKLNFHVYFRSWDLYGAFPENMGGMVLLMEFMANQLEIEVGMLSFSSLKLHCYGHSLEAVKARLNL